MCRNINIKMAQLNKILIDQEPVTFAQFYNQLPVKEAKNFKDTVKKACDWNYQMWYNKLYGRTKITKAESTVIIQLFNNPILKNILTK